MKVFEVKASGHYLGWHAVVFAEDRADAFDQALFEWEREFRKPYPPGEIMHVGEIKPEGVHVLFNGDY